MGLPALRKSDQIKGGAIISRLLAAEGVTRVFGIVDGTYLGLFGSFAEHGIALVTPRHETTAAHMAGAYARLTGGLGVCIASNGPGVANILPGVVVEQVEGNRVLLITSSRRAQLQGPDRGGAYQHFPQTAVTGQVAKWAVRVDRMDRLAETVRRALRACFTGRPGVVHLDVPEDLMNGDVTPDARWFAEPNQYRDVTPNPPAPDQVAHAVELLTQARKVVVHAGSGVVHAKAYAELAELAKTLEAPVTTSWGARCALDERDPRALPMVQIDAVNAARTQADLVLVLGSRLGETDWWGKAPYWGQPDAQQLIQVDVDPEVLGNVRPADLLVRADVKVFLQQLTVALKARRNRLPLAERKAWLADLGAQMAKHRAKLDKHLADQAVPMNPAHVAATLQRVLPDDTVTVFDGGNTAVWGNFFHQIRVPGTVLGTPKMGMLGAGQGQALGAAVATGKPVVCLIGDGAMGMHQQEVETAVRNGLPVLFVVVADQQWGMVKMTQQFAFKPLKTLIKKRLDEGETINGDLAETRFDDLGRAMGAYGERVADPAGLEGALRRALAHGGPAVIHVDVDPTKHMWAPGLRHFKAMHQEPQG
ncbi:MAG: thiamine pyrophosphate-binding protein [Myxococcales bacterium]|nr:thiamine pyrophosphate-binding protein [Myxococcales bacterium]MCB9523209.1 thiamine pyrophosphate-binding protein [Myxococcales bacterium]